MPNSGDEHTHDHTHEHITCEEVIAHMFEYLDDETDAEKRANIERHLEKCRACFSRAEFEKALRAKVRQVGDEKAPAELRRRVKTLLEKF